MEQNPLEKEKNNKIIAIREEIKHGVEKFFDMNELEQKKKIDEFIHRLKAYKENGLIFDDKKIENEVFECMSIKDKESFVSRFMKALEPIIIAKVTHPDIFRKIEIDGVKENRENIMSDDGNIRLSEILYAGLSNTSAHIHLADAYDFINKEKVNDFNLEIIKGLENLAKIIEPMKNIVKVTATSWIITPNPKRKKPNRIEELGFTLEGEISEEEKNKYFGNNSKTIYKASINRKKFDELYLKKESA